MRICFYGTGSYSHNSPAGGNAHIRQFVAQATALGHQVWLWRGGSHPDSHPVPEGKLDRLKLLRTMDLVYSRVEWQPPGNAKWTLPPRRQIVGSPLIAWEFNTVPEYALTRGIPEPMLQAALTDFRKYAPAVDLAVCVSEPLSEYVRKLGFKTVATVPNGSDPELFHPDVPVVKRLSQIAGDLNVVWIGSADLPWHNFDLLRDAAWSIWNSGDGRRIAFHVIGQGMQGMRDAPPNLNYYGPEEYERLPGWLSAMDVGLNVYHPGPADYSSPLKVFDYMASGLTVVSTDQPQVREIFGRLGQIDLLVPGDNPEALASTLRKLSADPDRLARQGAAGRQLVIDQYNWRRAAKDTFSALDKLRSH